MIKLIDKFMKWIEALLIGLLSTSVIIVVCQIIFRYVLGNPIGWSEQICRLLFMWTVMLGIPVIFNRNVIMAFDLILTALPNVLQTIVHILFNTLGVIFCGFYLRYGIQICQEMSGRVASGVPIPYWLMYGAQVCCAFLLGVVFLKRLYIEIKSFKKSEEVQ